MEWIGRGIRSFWRICLLFRVVHHPTRVSELIPGRCNDVAPVVAEQLATEGEMMDYKVPLECDGGHVIQEGRHVCMGKEGFDRGIDTTTGGFLLLVEDAQEGLEEVRGISDWWFLWLLLLFFL